MKVRPSRTLRPGAMCVTACTMLPQKPIAPGLRSVSATSAPSMTPAIGGTAASVLIDLPPPCRDSVALRSATVGRLPASAGPALLLSVVAVNDGFDRSIGAPWSPDLRHREEVRAHRLPGGLRLACQERLVDPPVGHGRLRHRIDQVRDTPADPQQLAHRVEHEREDDVPRGRRELAVEVHGGLE